MAKINSACGSKKTLSEPTLKVHGTLKSSLHVSLPVAAIRAWEHVQNSLIGHDETRHSQRTKYIVVRHTHRKSQLRAPCLKPRMSLPWGTTGAPVSVRHQIYGLRIAADRAIPDFRRCLTQFKKQISASA